MADVQHKSLDTTDLHKFAYIASSSPGAVGAGIGWVDTTTTPYVLKVRNAANTAWVVVGAVSVSALTDLTDVDTTGETTGKVLTFDGTNWVPTTPGTGGATTLHALTDVNDTGKSDGQLLKYDAGTSKWIPYTPTFGTSNGLSYYNPDMPYAVPSAFDDEFNAGSLDAKWVTYNTIPTITFPVPNHALFVPSHATQLRGIYQTPTWTNGDTYVMKITNPIRTGVGCNVGFLLIDAVGSRFSFTTFVGNASNSATWTFWSNDTTIFQSDTAPANYGNPPTMYLKIKYDTTTTKKMLCYISGNGVVWTLLFTTSANTFNVDNSGAPAKLGIVIYGTTTVDGIGIDWIRKLQTNSYPGQNITI